MYLDQTAPTANPPPPRERWPCSQNRILLARTACKQSAGSLIWVFMFQPLSNRELFSHRRWALASLTQITGEQKWQLRYQSLTSGTHRAVIFRPHMANAPLPPVAPMDDAYTYDWPRPLDAVWFPATTPLDGLCSPPPCLNPVTYAIDVMRRARAARACSIPRLWKDLLAYHALSANIAGHGTPVIDILDVFSLFDVDSFPCTLPDPVYGGVGSKFVILERAMAFDHALTSESFSGTSDRDTMDCPCVTQEGDAASPCSMSAPGFIPRVWSRVATDLPNFAHDSWVATDPSAWESDPPPLGLPYWCLCGASFDTLTRLQWHVNGVHPPGSQHSSSLRLLSRIGGSYIIYDPETRAIILCGMARYPISGGNKPSSTYAEACTIFLALFHARRVLHPGHTYSTYTDSLSSVHGWHKSGRPMTARASLSDKFSPLWLAVRTIVGNEVDHLIPGVTTVDWQCTEHGRRWSDPLRWTLGVLLRRVVDTAASLLPQVTACL